MELPTPNSAEGVETSSPTTAVPHPGEMIGTIRLAMRDFAKLTVSGRAMPAGFICARLLLCGGLFALRKVVSRSHGLGKNADHRPTYWPGNFTIDVSVIIRSVRAWGKGRRFAWTRRVYSHGRV
jgi:hypothetical protein